MTPMVLGMRRTRRSGSCFSRAISNTPSGGPDLAWWQLPLAQGAPPRRWIGTAIRAVRRVLEGSDALGVGPAGAVALGLSMGDFVSGVRLRVVDPSFIGSAASPAAGLARDHRAAIVAGTRAGVAAGIFWSHSRGCGRGCGRDHSRDQGCSRSCNRCGNNGRCRWDL